MSPIPTTGVAGFDYLREHGTDSKLIRLLSVSARA